MTADTDFAEILLSAARPAGAADPFVEALVDGRASRDVIRRYVVALTVMASVFPRRLAAILSICDEDEIRHSLIANLLEEEGVAAWDPAGGLRVAPERRHCEMARRLARAAGASDAEIRDAAMNIRESRWFSNAIDSGDWIGAYAYATVGHEGNVPKTFRQLIPPLIERYGFARGDLIFLTEHCEADERHGSESAQAIARVSRTDEARARALEGARRGGAAWRAWPRRAVGRDFVSRVAG